jgi:hypothetical protein
MFLALARLMLVVITASLLAVLSTQSLSAADAPQFRVTTFESDVTPPVDGHPLIWLTPVKTVESPLMARGIVIDDGTRRYVLCAVDWCGLCNSSYELFRSKLAAGAGTDVSNVAVQCVHPHTAPYTDGDAQKLLNQFEGFPMFVDLKFLDEATDRLAAAVKASLDKFQPFDRIGTGQAKVDRVASSRRIMVDGKLVGRSSSCTETAVRALPEGRIDPYLKTITLAQGDKPLVRLHYYACHPQTRYGDPRASSDMPGFARKRVEEKDGAFQMYFDGCGGDVAMGKYNDRSWEARDELTNRMVAGMEASIASTKYVPVTSLAWRTAEVLLPERTDPGNTLADSRALMNDPKADKIARVRAAVRTAFTERIKRPIECTSLQIGDVYIVNLCGECLIEFQFFAQQAKPNAFVAVAAYGDLGPGYLCPEAAYAEGGYEPSACNAGNKSEPVVKKAILSLLGEK